MAENKDGFFEEEETRTWLSSMKYCDLKKFAAEKKIKAVGKKIELVETILQKLKDKTDRNENHGIEDEVAKSDDEIPDKKSGFSSEKIQNSLFETTSRKMRNEEPRIDHGDLNVGLNLEKKKKNNVPEKTLNSESNNLPQKFQKEESRLRNDISNVLQNLEKVKTKKKGNIVSEKNQNFQFEDIPQNPGCRKPRRHGDISDALQNLEKESKRGDIVSEENQNFEVKNISKDPEEQERNPQNLTSTVSQNLEKRKKKKNNLISEENQNFEVKNISKDPEKQEPSSQSLTSTVSQNLESQKPKKPNIPSAQNADSPSQIDDLQMGKTMTRSSLKSLNRRQLQKLAMNYNIKANMKSTEIIDELLRIVTENNYKDSDLEPLVFGKSKNSGSKLTESLVLTNDETDDSVSNPKEVRIFEDTVINGKFNIVGTSTKRKTENEGRICGSKSEVKETNAPIDDKTYVIEVPYSEAGPSIPENRRYRIPKISSGNGKLANFDKNRTYTVDEVQYPKDLQISKNMTYVVPEISSGDDEFPNPSGVQYLKESFEISKDMTYKIPEVSSGDDEISNSSKVQYPKEDLHISKNMTYVVPEISSGDDEFSNPSGVQYSKESFQISKDMTYKIPEVSSGDGEISDFTENKTYTVRDMSVPDEESPILIESRFCNEESIVPGNRTYIVERTPFATIKSRELDTVENENSNLNELESKNSENFVTSTPVYRKVEILQFSTPRNKTYTVNTPFFNRSCLRQRKKELSKSNIFDFDETSEFQKTKDTVAGSSQNGNKSLRLTPIVTSKKKLTVPVLTPRMEKLALPKNKNSEKIEINESGNFHKWHCNRCKYIDTTKMTNAQFEEYKKSHFRHI